MKNIWNLFSHLLFMKKMHAVFTFIENWFNIVVNLWLWTLVVVLQVQYNMVLQICVTLSNIVNNCQKTYIAILAVLSLYSSNLIGRTITNFHDKLKHWCRLYTDNQKNKV